MIVDGSVMTVSRAHELFNAYQHQLESYGEGTCAGGNMEICGQLQAAMQSYWQAFEFADLEAVGEGLTQWTLAQFPEIDPTPGYGTRERSVAVSEATLDAMLSEQIRKNHPKEVGGYSMVEGSLEDLDNGLRAAVFTNGTRNVLVFAGTSILSGADWWANIKQAFGFKSGQYEDGIDLARSLYRGYDGNLSFAGHSLGGGIAAAAAIVTGGSANTFNAAGVHDNTLRGNDRSNGSINYYYSSIDIVRIANALTPASAAGTPFSMGVADRHPVGPVAYAMALQDYRRQ